MRRRLRATQHEMNETGAPDVVIIGAMKCATTTLHHYLSQHPLIAVARRKELDFFSHDEVWAKGLGWYGDQFADHSEGQLRLDSSPNYTKRQHWPDAARRMAAVSGDARLIYLIREPIARTRSAYIHEVSAGRQYSSAPDALSDNSNATTQTSRYAWQLEPYLEHFAPERILVVRFDELVSSPMPTVSRVLTFLELEQLSHLDDDPSAYNSSTSKTRPTPLVRGLGFKRARGLLRRIHPRLADRPMPDIEFSPELCRSIRAYLRPDLEELQRSGMIDIADWLTDVEG